MTTDTAQKIVDYIQSKGDVTAHELSGHLGISPQAIFRQLAKLIALNKLKKIGKPPKVFYSISNLKNIQSEGDLSGATQKLIENNFYLITPSGNSMKGEEAFRFWCQKQKLDVIKTADEYETTLRKYAVYKKNGFIDGMQKFKGTFKEV